MYFELGQKIFKVSITSADVNHIQVQVQSRFKCDDLVNQIQVQSRFKCDDLVNQIQVQSRFKCDDLVNQVSIQQ